MSRNLFVYGTLTFPETLQALVGKQFRSKTASLKHYSARNLKSKACPGLIPFKGEVTAGVVLFDVDDEAYAVIAEWEGGEYAPEEVRVSAGGQTLVTLTFVWQDM